MLDKADEAIRSIEGKLVAARRPLKYIQRRAAEHRQEEIEEIF